MKVLLVEDNKSLAKVLTEFFNRNNISISHKSDGLEGLYEAETGIYDVIILDVMLPSMDGFEILKALRKEKVDTPVLMLTARTTVPDKIEGLNLGADDYVSKPFDNYELLAMVKALSRRTGMQIIDSLAFGDLVYNQELRELKCQESTIRLSEKEGEIVEILLKNNKTYVNKEFLTQRIWNENNSENYNTVEIYISYIRKKLKAINSAVVIKSLRNVGYKFEIQV